MFTPQFPKKTIVFKCYLLMYVNLKKQLIFVFSCLSSLVDRQNSRRRYKGTNTKNFTRIECVPILKYRIKRGAITMVNGGGISLSSNFCGARLLF